MLILRFFATEPIFATLVNQIKNFKCSDFSSINLSLRFSYKKEDPIELIIQKEVISQLRLEDGK